jgi:predicted O-methyltransferase YrrM
MANIAKFINVVGHKYFRNKDQFLLEAEIRFKKECSIDGWASAGLMSLMNQAVGECISPDEYYLEIGTYAGRSLAGALQGNHALAYVIDNFWDSQSLLPTFKHNIKTFAIDDRVAYYEGNAETFTESLPKIGVMFYDANHDRGYTHFNLNKFESFLSDEAIIIIDDLEIEAGLGHTTYPGYEMKSMTPVLDDTIQWLREHPKSDLMMLTPWTFKQAWIHYRR